jgi:phage virion morphogenesis protein
MKVTASVNLDNLMSVEDRMKHLQHFYEAAGEILVGSIVKNFEEQGRPNRWKPLSAATVMGGAGYGGQRMTRRGQVTKGFERHLQGKQILITRGMLRNSIKKEATSEHAVAGSNLQYAAIHNFGGEAGRKSARVLIPARPFVMAQPEDHARMNEALRRWVTVGA